MMTQEYWDNNPLMIDLQPKEYALFLAQPPPKKPTFVETKAQRSAREFVEENSIVVIKCVEYALGELKAGRTRVGAGEFKENVRWKSRIRIRNREKNVYMLNNNDCAFISRLIQFRYPELEGKIETRKSQFDDYDYSQVGYPIIPGVKTREEE